MLLPQVGFSWSFTREALLACELRELEKLLAAKQEVLARLNPLSSSRVARLMGLQAAPVAVAPGGHAADGSASPVGDAGRANAAAAAVSPGQQAGEEEDWEGSMASDDTGDSSPFSATNASGTVTATAASRPSPRQHPYQHHGGRGSLVSCPNVFSGLDLGMADSSVVTLEVGVVEVANLSPRSGWSQDLTHALLSSAAAGSARRQTNISGSMLLSEVVKRNDLPLPVVYVFCGSGGRKDAGVEVGGQRCSSCRMGRGASSTGRLVCMSVPQVRGLYVLRLFSINLTSASG